MDYTIQEIRPLIYKDKKDIDCFDINGENSLDAEMLHKLELSDIVTLDGADKYILDIFNNAYYITTLIMMEKHPLHYFRKYITIAEHTGSAYYDIGERNTFYKSFSMAIMAMVVNHLRLLDKQYLSKNNQLTKRILDYFSISHVNEIKNHFSDYIVSFERIMEYHVDKQLFEPRIIDAQAINETECKFKQRYSSWDKMITDCARCSKDDFINALCKSDEEKNLLKNAVLKDGVIVVDAPQELGEALRCIKELEAEKKDLKDEISRLREQLEEKKNGMNTDEGKEEMIIELLMPIFYNDEKNVKDFLSKINHLVDTQITDLVHEWSQPGVNKISSWSKNRPLWSVLHAAKLYRATDRNWDTALRKNSKRDGQ